MASQLQLRLKELRERAKLTVRSVADAVGKTPGYISRIEGRGEVPSHELLHQLAELYHIPAEELFNLAKESQLKRVQEEINAKYEAALALYKKGKK